MRSIKLRSTTNPNNGWLSRTFRSIVRGWCQDADAVTLRRQIDFSIEDVASADRVKFITHVILLIFIVKNAETRLLLNLTNYINFPVGQSNF